MGAGTKRVVVTGGASGIGAATGAVVVLGVCTEKVKVPVGWSFWPSR